MPNRFFSVFLALTCLAVSYPAGAQEPPVCEVWSNDSDVVRFDVEGPPGVDLLDFGRFLAAYQSEYVPPVDPPVDPPVEPPVPNDYLDRYEAELQASFGSSGRPTIAAEPSGMTTYSGSAVNTCGEVNALVDAGSAHLVLGATAYSCSLSVDGDDVWVEMDNGTSFTGLSTGSSSSRVKITGGMINGSSSNTIRGEDIYIENLNVVATNSSGQNGFQVYETSGFTFVGNTVIANSYAFLWSGNAATSNLVFIANDLDGGVNTNNATIRMQNISSSISAGNLFKSQNPGYVPLRMWSGHQDHLMTGNHVYNTAGAGSAPWQWARDSPQCGTVSNLWYRGNYSYRLGNNNSNSFTQGISSSCSSTGATCGNLFIEGNFEYERPPISFNVTTQSGAASCSPTVSGNISDAYENAPYGGNPACGDIPFGCGADH